VPAHDLFFSYRRADLPRAALLHDALTRTGLSVWFDQTHIPDHAPITQEIRKGIAASKALLAFYSRTYPDSRPCQMELMSAWLAAQHLDKGATRRVLILNPESPDFRHIPRALQDSQSPPFPSDPAGFDELARRIRDHIGRIEGPLLTVSADPPRYFGMSPVSAQRFIGRAAQLWALHGSLLATDISIITGQTGQSVAQIVGMPGNGKSLLAQEYAIRFGAAFPGGIFWINAFGNPDRDESGAVGSQTTSREDQIREFARQLRIPGINNLEPGDVPAAFWNFLDISSKRCLWIVDDLASDLDRAGFDAWLPKSGQAATLITTRTHSYEWTAGALHLDVLTPKEAEQLLALHRAPKTDAEADALRAIARELGRHPLAVEVAGSYLAKGFTTFSQYLADLCAPTRPDDILESSAKLKALLPTAHSRSIFRTFGSSIRQLGEEGQDFLRLASVLAAAPISLEFVGEVLGADRLVSAIDQVDTLSLCEKAGDDARVVHTLVSRTMQAFLGRQEPGADLIRASAVRALGKGLSVVDDIRMHESVSGLVVHARHLVSIHLDDREDARLAGWVARHDYRRGEFTVARALEEQALEVLRLVRGADHPDTLTSMNNLAGTLGAQGDRAGARALQEQVLEASRRVLIDEHPDTLISMNNLAATLLSQGNLAGARQLHEEALAAHRRVLGGDHPNTLTSMNNLAEALGEQGDLAGARTFQEQVLEARRRVLGDEHNDTLTSMSNLAVTLFGQGDLAGARELQEQVLTTSERVLGAEHPDTIGSMNNLAQTLLSQGDIARARALNEQVLQARRRVVGDSHPETIGSMNNLAATLWAQGDVAGARNLLEQVIEAYRRAVGVEHPDTLIAMSNLA
jgi:tetratricopeptide (TPR) repeat protein